MSTYSDDYSQSSNESRSSGDESEEEFRDDMRVFLRLRPMNKLEQSRRSKNCIELHEDPTVITVDSPLEGEYDFTFDHIFEEYASQDEVYEQAVDGIPQKVLEGYNCCLLAYGQTGTGKTHTILGADGGRRAVGRTETRSPGTNMSSGGNGDGQAAHEVDETGEGMIPRAARALFDEIKNSKKGAEFTVRCSYVEIYLEKVLDLLQPQNSCSVVNDAQSEGSDDGIRIRGASELCCLDQHDVSSLVARGNACRTMSSTEMNTDSSRSHAIFILRLCQRNPASEKTFTSTLLMCDLAGSELGSPNPNQRHKRGSNSGKPGGSGIQVEANMINKSLTELQKMIRFQLERQRDGNADPSTRRLHQSKLTRLLRPAFGGSYLTTVILTASPSSYNIGETISTIRFGQRARKVINAPLLNEQESTSSYKHKFLQIQREQQDKLSLVMALAMECKSMKENGGQSSNESLWKVIDDVLEKNGDDKEELTFVITSKSAVESEKLNGSSRSTAATDPAERIITLEKELKLLEMARTSAENSLAELQSEVAVLRTQNENLTADKARSMQELIDAKNEVQMLSQRKLEVEHNLRTSQFRENEAIVFLRQFRRFYRNVLKDKAAHGAGSVNQITSEIAEKVASAPDLTELRDIDTLLLESGLIEEHELGEDRSSANYKPSKEALLRSAGQAQRAAVEDRSLEVSGDERDTEQPESASEDATDSHVADDEVESKSNTDESESDDSNGGGRMSQSEPHAVAPGYAHSISRAPHTGLMVTRRQKLLRTPSGRLTTMREKDVEAELLEFAKRCIKLQEDLSNEKATCDALTNKSGGLSKKRLAQEAILLRQQLEKKTASLTAIAWKMNELNLINKTYNEKMVNREQHVLYLEESLVDLQNNNRRLLVERQETEKKLRDDLEQLQKIVDGMTIPLWQFGETKVESTPLESRIIVPIPSGSTESACSVERRRSVGDDDVSVDNDEKSENQTETLAGEASVQSTGPRTQLADATCQTEPNEKPQTAEIDVQTEATVTLEVETQTESIDTSQAEIQTDEVEFKREFETSEVGTMTMPEENGRANADVVPSAEEVASAKEKSLDEEAAHGDGNRPKGLFAGMLGVGSVAGFGAAKTRNRSNAVSREDDPKGSSISAYLAGGMAHATTERKLDEDDESLSRSNDHEGGDERFEVDSVVSRKSNRMYDALPPLSENRARANSEVSGDPATDFVYDDLGKRWGMSERDLVADARVLTPTRTPRVNDLNPLLGVAGDEKEVDEVLLSQPVGEIDGVEVDGKEFSSSGEQGSHTATSRLWRTENESSLKGGVHSEGPVRSEDTYDDVGDASQGSYGSGTEENTKGDDDFDAMMSETAAALRYAEELLPSDDETNERLRRLENLEQDDSIVSPQKYEGNSSEDDNYMSPEEKERRYRKQQSGGPTEATPRETAKTGDGEMDETHLSFDLLRSDRSHDYQPHCFGEKRGREIKSAVMKEGKKSLLPEYDEASVSVAPDTHSLTLGGNGSVSGAPLSRTEQRSSSHNRSPGHSEDRESRRRKKKSSSTRSYRRDGVDSVDDSPSNPRQSSRQHSGRKKKNSGSSRHKSPMRGDGDSDRKSSKMKKKTSSRDGDRPRRRTSAGRER